MSAVVLFIIFLCFVALLLMNIVRTHHNRRHVELTHFFSSQKQSLFVVCRSCGSHLQKGNGSVCCHKCHHSV